MEETSSLVYTTIYSLLATVFYLPLFIYFLINSNLQFTTLSVIAIIISGISNVLGYLTYNQSIKIGEISEEVPLSKLTPIFTAILGALILGEQLTLLNYIGIFAVVAGTFIILVDPLNLIKSFKQKETFKPALIAVASGIIFAFASIADRYATQTIDPKIYTMLIYLIMLTAYIPTLHKKQNKSVTKTVKKQLQQKPGLYTLTGILAITASLAIFKSFSLAPASKVIPLIQIQVIFSILGGKIFGDQNLPRKLTGTTLLLTGITLVLI
jgi:transporter family protein